MKLIVILGVRLRRGLCLLNWFLEEKKSILLKVPILTRFLKIGYSIFRNFLVTLNGFEIKRALLLSGFRLDFVLPYTYEK